MENEQDVQKLAGSISEISVAKKTLEGREKELKSRLLELTQPGDSFETANGTVAVHAKKSLVIDGNLISDLKRLRLYSKASETKVSASKIKAVLKENSKASKELANEVSYSESTYIDVR